MIILRGLVLSLAGVAVFTSALAYEDNYNQSFEVGVLPPEFANSVPGVAGGWSIDTASVADGSYSIISDSIAVNEQAATRLSLETHESDLRFKIYVNAYGLNPFILRVNGVDAWVSPITQQRGWTWSPVIRLKNGINEIDFIYSEPSVYSAGCNCARIDRIEITNLDLDLDGILDSWELQYGLNPADPADALIDSDADGLTNLEEYGFDSNPNDPDNDGDGLLGPDEIAAGTDPFDADSDGDRITDGYEVQYGLDPLIFDSNLDPDGDGYNNLSEYRGKSNPLNFGSIPVFRGAYLTSYEGARPLDESWYGFSGDDLDWEVTDKVAYSGSRALVTKPLSSSSTSAVSLFVSKQVRIEPSYLSAVIGISSTNTSDYVRICVSNDCQYVYGSAAGDNVRAIDPIYIARANQLDLQYIGFTARLNGLNQGNYGWTDLLRISPVDGDGDGMDYLWEINNGFDPDNAADALLDADSDGINNKAEQDLGTDPNNSDSDADGLSDGDEVNSYGSDPLNTDSDGDNMTDGYEAQYGLDPTSMADAKLDADGDGLSNEGELAFGTDPSNAASVPAYTDDVFESFENALLPAGWVQGIGAEGSWAPENVTATDGSWSLRSDPVSSDGDAVIEIPLFVHESNLSFRFYWNADEYPLYNPGSDYLRVSVNGEQVLLGLGSRHWKPSGDIRLQPGYNLITIAYQQSNGGQYGCGCVRLDEFRVINLDADVDFMLDDWELANGFNPAEPADAALDSDGDGLSNLDEYRYNTNPSNADTDGDGVSDGDEVNIHGSAPNSADTDGDRMPDAFEIAAGLDYLDVYDGLLDLDGDGVSNIVEFRLQSDPNDAGSLPPLIGTYQESFEGSGLPNNWFTYDSDELDWEISGVTSSDGAKTLRSKYIDKPAYGAFVSRSVHLLVYTEDAWLSYDQRIQGASGYENYSVRVDGLVQPFTILNSSAGSWFERGPIFLAAGVHEIEFRFGTNLNTNGLSYGFLDNLLIVPDDADGDGMQDSWETENGLNPADPGDAATDLDGDGLSNADEFAAGTNPDAIDTDGDGINDSEELNVLGTDPLNSDSDGDGMTDGFEQDYGFDPQNPADALADFDGDGLNNVGEAAFGTNPNDAGSIAPYIDNYSESFESGTLPSTWRVPVTANGGWSAKNVTATDGSWSLESDSVSVLESAEVVLPLFIHESVLNFSYYFNGSVQSKFELYVNGELQIFENGSEGRFWKSSSDIVLKAGYNELKFLFTRGVFSNGCRCVRIDNIQITNQDNDLDFMNDQWELDNGLSPLDPTDALLDGDGDGLNNAGEYANGTDITKTDTDNDGLSDAAEVQTHNTDPTLADTDGDSMGDAFEVSFGLNGRDAADADLDTDGDGLVNKGESYFGSDPTDALSYQPYIDGQSESFEGGTVPAYWEQPAVISATKLGWKATNVAAQSGSWSLQTENLSGTGISEISFMVNARPDTTMDLRYMRSAFYFSQFAIVINGVNVFETDFSSPRFGWQSLNDIPLDSGFNEIRFVYDKSNTTKNGCDCLRIDSLSFSNPDTDADGIPDVWEQANGLNYLDGADGALDSDADLLDNLGEYQAGTNPFDNDSDDDYLWDGYELTALGTNPMNYDTDGDGMPDPYELNHGMDPLVDSAMGDMDGDGISNIGEYRLVTNPINAGSVPTLLGSYIESFEGSLGAGWFSPGRYYGIDWKPSTNTKTDGVRALRSAAHPIGNALTSKSVGYYVNVADSTFSIDYRVLGNPDDQFFILVDGVAVVSVTTGGQYWVRSSEIPLSAGEHSIEFVSESVLSDGHEKVYIDNFIITPL